MAVQQARVPVLDAGGRFPDAYAPPSVAADTQAAQAARVGAESARDGAQEARTGAETARGQAEVARQGAETALAGVPAAVEGALAPQVQAATDAAEAAHDSAEAAQGSARAAAQAADSRIAAGLASGGVIKVADDATLSAAKSYADSGVAQVNTWFLRGNGRPVGVVKPASAGVQYVDLAATNGARVWISTGNTRWTWSVVNGDTGKRNITSLLINGWAASSVVVQRVNRFATLQAVDLRIPEGSTGGSLFAALNGFALPTNGTSVIGFTRGSSNTLAAQASVWSGTTTGTLILEPPAAFVSSRSASFSWPTNDTWPTTLPGTPA